MKIFLTNWIKVWLHLASNRYTYIIKDTLDEANINDLSNSWNSRLKHELTVVQNEIKQLKDDFDLKILKAESEVKKVRGRVGSLVEEKGNLLEKTKILEDVNEVLKSQVTSLHDIFQLNIVGKRSKWYLQPLPML